MRPNLAQLMHEIEAKKVFKRNRKDVRLKILAALLYLFGLSLRKASQVHVYFRMGHESVRAYYHRLKEVIKPPEKRGGGL